MFFYSGLNTSPKLLACNNSIIDKFSKISMDNVASVTIAWNYLVIFQDTGLVYLGKSWSNEIKELIVPDNSKIQSTSAGKDFITILTIDHEIWQYHVYQDFWKKIDHFFMRNENNKNEFVIKIEQNSCIVALTNLGRVFNVPNPIELPKSRKFIDIACGFDHTIMLADNGDVYSMGMGTRGQLGHGDLEDCDEPRLIEALGGLKISQIAAGSWHNAALTTEGDLYTWGWNTNGELGIISDQKVFACPVLIDFTDGNGDVVDARIKKIQCGNSFTICITDDGSLWGCGSNKYGQLGRPSDDLLNSKLFTKIPVEFDVRDFYCKEFGSIIVVDNKF